ncbi:hypothetical protein H310_03209 [Aphanomyces invadans]|uniref:Uncharacterized protein n=1 Tax=Aphanomyces invadans TaxID=157072 RepID=A0A024UGQ6_9STRA|nr:hypothetical protein H310_03209 [Aphanomyces invadans]ETW05444.1 hypothetical protein H310_03209 [Aphanomyces invadans]|eukprot:XP_008865221.1 hypothetical protein H310_03209 [Aphanomyces invadans]
MLDDLIRVLEQDHQEWVLHQEGKMVVEKQLQLQRNKALKSDVFRFVNWLRQFSAGFQLYVGLEEASPAPPKPNITDKGGRGKGKTVAVATTPRKAAGESSENTTGGET